MPSVASEIADPEPVREPKLYTDYLMYVGDRGVVFSMNAIESFQDTGEAYQIRVVFFDAYQTAWLPALKAGGEGNDSPRCTEDRHFR